ncbi:hypothetical protein [Streptomyces sp. NPDC005548]|uniref:hypothetical protein n=1 Tax=Streptomyces sp. NPDC005548 TaxID=3364724 RepID=UPI0036A38BBB
MAHPIDAGRCARAAGHEMLDDAWSWCSAQPHLPAHIWQGYHAAKNRDRQAQNEARLAAMSQAEHAAWVAEADAAYWAEMADDVREPYDPREDKYEEMAREALEEEHWADEPDGSEHSAATVDRERESHDGHQDH